VVSDIDPTSSAYSFPLRFKVLWDSEDVQGTSETIHFSHDHKILEMSLRKKPSSNRQKPPRKQRKIHDLLLPSSKNDSRSAINHSSRANLRIIAADYTSF
jgi:hypothetical protein